MAGKRNKNNDFDDVHKVTVLQRFVGGTVGGMLQALTSHPFDTVKSRVQRGIFPGIVSCCRHTWANEGFHGFYRGLSPPLVMGGVYNSILFSLNQFMTNLLTPAGFDHKVKPPLWRTALSAWLTAPIYTLCITPMENVKVRLQLQHSSRATPDFTGPIGCIRCILVREGPLGLLAGYLPTALSRLVGLPFYFSGYQLAKQQIDNSAFGATTAGKSFGVVVSGCVAGVVFWLSNYPFDFVKTQLQSGGTKTTFSEVFASTYKTGGVRGFYRGLPACLLRAIPANASVWLGVEWTTRAMRNYNV
ncbi:mitochondrial carrier protein [Trypanosoma conorhini]|uniref:Mitochondrial carrier protein n=1 Tax=Trypanosoma conorhini TaxID=83891 RepID=A0A3R7NXY4_9TRYP|nr:mitochondrial carrier protein [Trypanosoma conorhini]RNF13664.1 mitochondrial carrier protein [Trypanosoma conorhini]